MMWEHTPVLLDASKNCFHFVIFAKCRRDPEFFLHCGNAAKDLHLQMPRPTFLLDFYCVCMQMWIYTCVYKLQYILCVVFLIHDIGKEFLCLVPFLSIT